MIYPCSAVHQFTQTHVRPTIVYKQPQEYIRCLVLPSASDLPTMAATTLSTTSWLTGGAPGDGLPSVV